MSLFSKTLYYRSFRGLSSEVWFLSVVMLINRSGMMVLPFLTLYLTQQLGWSKLDTGIATSCFGLGSIAGSFIGGWLSDKIGTFKVMVLSLFWGGACFYLFLYVTNFYGLCFLIFLTTTIGDAFRPALFTAIQQYSEDENLTRGISLVRMAINLGISIGPAIGGFLAAAYGYDWLFIIDGTTCIIASLFLLVLFKPQTKKNVVENIEEASDQVESQSPFKDRIFILFMLNNLIMLIVFFQILYSVPVFFGEVFQLDESQIGWFFTANGLIIFFFEMPIIYVLEKKNKTYSPMIYGVILMSIGFLSLMLFDSVWTVVILFTLFASVGEIINFPFISTVAIRRADQNNKGKYMGATTVLFSLAFMLAPLSGLPVIQLIGYEQYWLLAAALMWVSVLGYLYLKPLMKPNSLKE